MAASLRRLLTGLPGPVSTAPSVRGHFCHPLLPRRLHLPLCVAQESGGHWGRGLRVKWEAAPQGEGPQCWIRKPCSFAGSQSWKNKAGLTETENKKTKIEKAGNRLQVELRTVACTPRGFSRFQDIFTFRWQLGKTHMTWNHHLDTVGRLSSDHLARECRPPTTGPLGSPGPALGDSVKCRPPSTEPPGPRPFPR